MTSSRVPLVLAAALFAPLAFSQEAPHPSDPMRDHLFPPDLILQNQKALGLEDEQRSAIRSEVLKAQPRFTDLEWKLQDAMEILGSLVKPAAVDEAKVLEQLDKVLALERELKRSQVGLMVRLKNRLSGDQQAKLRQIRPSGR